MRSAVQIHTAESIPAHGSAGGIGTDKISFHHIRGTGHQVNAIAAIGGNQISFAEGGAANRIRGRGAIEQNAV